MNDQTKGRRIIRALPTPATVAMLGLAVALLVSHSHLLGVLALSYALYVVVAGEVGAVFDPECRVPEHQHEDCPACGDLPPLVPVRRFFRRIRRGTAR